MEKILLRPEEAAHALGLSRSKVYQLIAAGRLPSVRVGNCVRVSAQSLRSWLESLNGEQSREKSHAPETRKAPGAATPDAR